MNRIIRHTAIGTALTLTGALFFLAPAHAGPEGAVVQHGTAFFFGDGPFYGIAPSNGAVIQYTSFNIGMLETVHFFQADSSHAVLNVIPTGGATAINGKIEANGIVFFANPSGFVFGPSSVVDANGFYAAAAHIDATERANFNNAAVNGTGNFTFNVPASGAMITVQNGAQILGASGVGLIGRQIVNHGQISVSGNSGAIYMAAVSGGDVTVGAGNYLVTLPLGNVGGVVDATDGPGIHNSSTGSISATGDNSSIHLGASDLYGLAVRLHGSGEIDASEIAFSGAGGVELASSVSLTADESITFHAGVNSSANDAHSLTIDAEDATVIFAGDVGNAPDGALGELSVKAKEIKVTNVATLGSQVYEAGDGITLGSTYTGLDFLAAGPVTLIDAVIIDVTESVSFLGPVDGPGRDLTVNAGETTGGILFQNDIGSGGALGEVTLMVGNAGTNAALADAGSIIMFGQTGGGTFLLNAGALELNYFVDVDDNPVYIGHTPFATIGSPNDGLTINTDQFTMGLGQKLTVLGDLMLTVDNGGTALLGDINTFGDMIVNSPGGITILRRPPGGPDVGVDFYAFGAIDFTGDIDFEGAGAMPIFANPTATGPADQIKMQFSPTLEHFKNADGRLLDVAGQVTLVQEFASIVAAEEADDGAYGGDEEGRELQQGRDMFVDTEPSEIVPAGATWSHRISARRLSSREVSAFAAREQRMNERMDAMNSSLTAAWQAYRQAHGEAAIPVGFAAFLAQDEALRVALGDLQEVVDYVRAMEAMGMSPREAQDAAWQSLHEDFLPSDMTKEQFVQTVRSVRQPQTVLR